MAIRRWFGKSVKLDALPAELKGLLEDMRRERSAFEAALVRAADVVRVAEGLGDSVAQAQKSSEQLSGRLAIVDGLSERLRSLQAELDALAAGGRETREQMGETGRLVQAARSDLDALQPRLQEVIGLKGDLAGILEQATHVREQEGQLRDAMARVEEGRGRQEEIGKGVADAASRLAEVQGRLDRIAAGVDGLTTRVEAFAQTAAELRQLTTDAPNLKRELGTLRTMAEFVSQKVTSLEGQRDAVERATRRADGLTELMAQVDRQYAEQQTNAKFLAQLEERVHGLKQLHETLLEQTEEIRRRQGEIEAQGRAQQEAFEGAGAAVQDALSGFAFERDGLAAMNQRVQDLREAVASVQQRLPALDAATAGLADVEATAQRLGARVATLQEEVAQVEAAAAALGPVREELRAETAELTGRLERESEALRSRLTEAGDAAARAEGQVAEIEERSRRLSEVGTRLGTFERRYSDLLDAGDKIERSQLLLDQRREALNAVRDDLTRLFGVADATVEKVRSVAALQKEIEQRRQAVEDMAGRLRQFDRYGEQLEVRGRQFAEAEHHLELLDAHLTDMKTQLATVLEQRDFLEKVIETTATLAFQTMQAESVLAQLREERGEGGAGATGGKGSGRPSKSGRP